jgi:hypothetical protein
LLSPPKIAHLRDAPIGGHHHRLTALGVAECHVALGPRLAGPVEPEQGPRGPGALAETGDRALEPRGLLRAELPHGLGQVEDLREQPALPQAGSWAARLTERASATATKARMSANSTAAY